MKLRASRPEDVPRLFEIWRAAVLATHDFLSDEDFQAIEPLVRDQYLPASSFDLAVDDTDLPLGFLGMTDAHIDALFVDPAHHGRGVGRRLAAHALERNEVVTVDVNEQNGGAVAFYKRLGFVRVARSSLDDQGRPYPLLHLRWDVRASRSAGN